MAIAFDNKTQNTSSATTFSHTTTGGNLILIVKVVTPSTVTGVTYAGVSMTQAGVAVNVLDANTNVYLFYLKAPATGANNVVISGPATCTSSAISFTGAKQTGGVDVSTPYYNSVTENGNITVTVNVTTANSWLLAAQDSHLANPDAAVSGTIAFTTSNSAWQDVYSNAPVGSGNQTIGYHWTTLDNHAIIALAFAPDSNVGFDNASTGAFSASGTSLTYSKTNTGANGVLLVGLLLNGTNSITATATYNSVSMIASTPVNVGTGRIYIFYLENPAVGSNTVAITASSSVSMNSYAVSYIQCYQGSPFPDATNSTSPGSNASCTASVTTTVDNCWTALWGVNQGNNNTIAAGSGSTLRTTVNDGIGWFDSNAVVHPAGSNSMTFTQSGTPDAIGGYIISLAPLGSSYPTTITGANMSLLGCC